MNGGQKRHRPADETGRDRIELAGEINPDGTTEVGQPAEVVAEFTEAEARDHTDRINQAVGIAGDLVVEAWNRRIWTTLGYSSWEDYCATEIRYEATGQSKAVLMVGLRKAGASYRAIGAATGVSHQTAMRELADATGPNGPVEQPERITGTDGKTRPSTKSKPSVEPTGSEHQLEEIARREWVAYLRVGIALGIIRDRQLYAAEHPNFESYVRDRWNIEPELADELIGSIHEMADQCLGFVRHLEEGARRRAWEALGFESWDEMAEQLELPTWEQLDDLLALMAEVA